MSFLELMFFSLVDWFRNVWVAWSFYLHPLVFGSFRQESTVNHPQYSHEYSSTDAHAQKPFNVSAYSWSWFYFVGKGDHCIIWKSDANYTDSFTNTTTTYIWRYVIDHFRSLPPSSPDYILCDFQQWHSRLLNLYMLLKIRKFSKGWFKSVFKPWLRYNWRKTFSKQQKVIYACHVRTRYSSLEQFFFWVILDFWAMLNVIMF